MSEAPAALSPWDRAELAAALFAIDPFGSGGIVVRAQAGPVRDAWLAALQALMPGTRCRRLPLHAGDDRLLGGLDLAASLAAGRPVADPGFLAEAHGRVVLLPMAERLSASHAARIGAVADGGEVVLERDGLALRTLSRFGIVAFDEGCDDEERPPAALRDRSAFEIDLRACRLADTGERGVAPNAVQRARDRLADVAIPPPLLDALAAAAAALGIGSLRAPLLAVRTARALAALRGEQAVTEVEASLAAGLVLAHRATILPRAEPEEARSPPPGDADDVPDDAPGDAGETGQRRAPEDVVLAAAEAAIPPGLLAAIAAGRMRARADAFGRGGAPVSGTRGRPAGTRAGRPGRGVRLALVDTLRAAAPWQRLRRREDAPSDIGRVEVRRDDFRIARFKQRTETTTIVVVDASGSSAFHRLAEVKGAVELLLAESYVRRDRVALIAFRRGGAELLLPPTRSLARARRNLAGLPGGGPTPLAAGIDAAAELALAVKRGGRTPAVVLITDARANVARDGTIDRPRAQADALAAARALATQGTAAILVDSSPRPGPDAPRIAEAMGARYVPLPHAQSASLSAAMRAGLADARQATPG